MPLARPTPSDPASGRARAQLSALIQGGLPPSLTHEHQHLGLVSDFVAYHVVSKPLKSLRFLGGVMPEDADVAP